MARAPVPVAGLRVVIIVTAAIVASQVVPIVRTIPLLPTPGDPSRSPSSDALMQTLPLPHAADRVDALAATLPAGHGIVVAHGTEAHLTAAYYALAMRLWPRQAHVVFCDPEPRVETTRGPVPSIAHWRVDLLPQDANPLRSGAAVAVEPVALCADVGSPPEVSSP